MNAKINGSKSTIVGIWFQSRANILLLYITCIIPLRDYIITKESSPYTFSALGNVLLTWSVVNLFFAIVYVVWWWFVRPDCTQSQTTNN